MLNQKNAVHLNLFRPSSPYPQRLELLNGESIFAGLATSCKIRLAGPEVSQFHCMFFLAEDGVVVQNCQTGGQLAVNGRLVATEITCQPGDEIRIGQNCILVAQDPLPQANTEPSTLADHDHSHSQSAAEWDGDSPITRLSPAAGSPKKSAVRSELSSDDCYGDDTDGASGEDDSWNRFQAGFEPEQNLSSQDDSLAELELLRSEIEFLQAELSDKEQRIQQMCNRVSLDEDDLQLSGQHDLVNRLTCRLEELLQEMQQSDERIRVMEDLLQATDEANSAEQDERRQLESWLGEVESRISQREGEAEIEIERLRKRCSDAEQRQKLAETQLKKLINKSFAQEKSVQLSGEAIQQMQQRIEQQERLLAAAADENEALHAAIQRHEQNDQQEKICELEEKLVRLELDSSRERAELARQRAELEAQRAQMQRASTNQRQIDEIDCRMIAMRQHLREIHEEEKQAELQKKQNSLGHRIARLLNRI